MVLAGELSRLCLICIAIVEFALSAPTAAGAVLAPKALRVSSLRTIPLSRASWFWSSAPLYDMGDTLAPATPVPATLAEHAQASWYDPPRDPSTRFAIERDLNPVLTAEDGGGDLHNVLEMNLQPPTGQSGLTASNWAGLTQSLSTVPLHIKPDRRSNSGWIRSRVVGPCHRRIHSVERLGWRRWGRRLPIRP